MMPLHLCIAHAKWAILNGPPDYPDFPLIYALDERRAVDRRMAEHGDAGIAWTVRWPTYLPNLFPHTG